MECEFQRRNASSSILHYSGVQAMLKDDRILSAEPAQKVNDVPRTTRSYYAPISRIGGLDKAPTLNLKVNTLDSFLGIDQVVYH